MIRTVLVTGGAGFIGSHLVERLLKGGDRVVCLDNINGYYDPFMKLRNAAICRTARPDSFSLVLGDVRDGTLLRRIFEDHSIDSVAHLAALPGVRGSARDAETYVSNNVEGTRVLLEACGEAGVRRFLFASSSSVYGRTPGRPWNEESPCRPTSVYGWTKLQGELLCRDFCGPDTAIAVVRLFSVYGPRQRPDLVLPIFVDSLMHGRTLSVFGDGNQERDLTYIADAVFGIEKALNWLKAGPGRFEIFNLAGGRSIALCRLIALLEGLLRTKAAIRYLPSLEEEAPTTLGDTAKAEQVLGYRPRTDIQAGLESFLKWYSAERVNEECKRCG